MTTAANPRPATAHTKDSSREGKDQLDPAHETFRTAHLAFSGSDLVEHPTGRKVFAIVYA